MGSLSGALLSSANALSVFDRVLNVIENNVTNSNTPGYAKQDQLLVGLPFDPAHSLGGGLAAGQLISSRSEYIEQSVRNQQQSLGSAEQRAADLNQIEPLFSLTSASGIANSLSSFFNTFSQLTVNPNNEVSRQAVITQAGALAQNINESAKGIALVSSNVTSQTGVVVSQINQLAGQIAAINQRFRANSQASQDESLDTNVHNALENLSSLANISVIRTADGEYNVYLGGQTPLVLGDTVSAVTATNVSSQTAILDAQGVDITAQISSGHLGALIHEKNATLPGYLADLNTLAQSLADKVNTTLVGGLDQNGNPPAADLFTYSASNAAATIAVTGITPDQIAAASAASPGGNGNAVVLFQLSNAAVINGFSFTQFYGNLGSRVGSDVSFAHDDQSQTQDQLTQAQAQRNAISGVDLNAEAAKLLQFQQAFQAVGKLVGVLDSLTATVINMIQP